MSRLTSILKNSLKAGILGLALSMPGCVESEDYARLSRDASHMHINIQTKKDIEKVILRNQKSGEESDITSRLTKNKHNYQFSTDYSRKGRYSLVVFLKNENPILYQE